MTTQRRLAAILACDVVGYSRLTERDERGTLERLKIYRKDLLEPLVSEHQGRIVKLTGDGMLCEFASVVNAVTSAMAIQQALAEHEAETPEEERIRFRIGVNLSDVVCEEDGDLYGDGVNIAARLESIADPGTVVVSGTAYDHLQGKLDYGFTPLGDLRLKNIARPVRAYRVETDASASVAALPPLPEKPSIAVLPFTNMSGDPDQEYFADGLVEDIITGLSRVNSFFVIARNSSFTYKGRAVDLRQVGRELGVRYVLEGSIRRAGSRVRISGAVGGRDQRTPCLGRPLRGRRERHLRPAGQGDRERRRRRRAEHPAGGDQAGAHEAYRLHQRLRPLPSRAAALLQHDARRLCRRAPAHQRGAQHRP
ncbi:adenylate/guanylate cyclase domain-containing protein [Mesorhizobium sp.]|uniref:adenylate/guanylate cyclase domain-containing protein n=1 Tax=Mesorhizobium sp. TaxID=1871066 RepID=UPI00257BEB9C|nr:adenylate/guanylate cyclase domain-containing protein [Mesorhizobium sp.]